jgi:hypothetical protein
MICPDCFGSNMFCEECGGSGIAYCCEGYKESLIPLPDSYKESPIDFDWEALQRLRKSSIY